jgi:hypothetical protein
MFVWFIHVSSHFPQLLIKPRGLFAQAIQLGNCNKFYFTFEFEYQMWVQIFHKIRIPICHLSD